MAWTPDEEARVARLEGELGSSRWLLSALAERVWLRLAGLYARFALVSPPGEKLGLASSEGVLLLANAREESPTVYTRIVPGYGGSAAFSFQASGSLVVEYSAGSGSPITWTERTRVGVTPSLDEAGWYVTWSASGRRVFTRRWLGVALAAAADQNVVSAAALPTGIADLSAVHILGVHHRMTASPQRVALGVGGGEATTTLTVVAATTDGGTLSSKAATIDVFVTLIER